MKVSWTTKRIGDFCMVTDFVANGSFAALRENVKYLDEDGYAVLIRLTDSTKDWNGPFKYVSKEAYNFLRKSSLIPGDLIMSNVGEPGRVFLVPDLGKPMTLGPNAILIRGNRADVDTQFLYYYFSSVTGRAQIDEISEGAAQKKFNKTDFRNLDVTLPPFPEQRRIVSILNEAFDAIATAKANAEKNLQNARALFENHLQDVFARRGVTWNEMPLGMLANFRNGINYTKESKGERVKVVGVKDFQKNYRIPLANLDTVVIDGKLSELDALKQGDILAVRSNGNLDLIGRCILAEDIREKITHSGFTIRIRLSSGEVLPQYLCYFMKCSSSRQQLIKGGTGTNIKSLNQQTLFNLAVPFPVVSEQKALVAKLERLSEETQRLESIYKQKLAALDELKKSLLHQAFSGEL